MRAARILATVGPLALAPCLAAVSCGLDRSGLLDGADDGGPTTGADGTLDGGQVVADAQPGEPSVDVASLDDVAADGAQQDVQVQEAAPPADVTSELPPPTCTQCGAGSCCSAGGCVPLGNQACGDPGQVCTDCTKSTAGLLCILLAGHDVCGCSGPGRPDQCGANQACYNQQCGTACDGQHPCNGGCCSGNDLATSVCVTACTGGMTCEENYCQ